jgi:hypothetical protein
MKAKTDFTKNPNAPLHFFFEKDAYTLYFLPQFS